MFDFHGIALFTARNCGRGPLQSCYWKLVPVQQNQTSILSIQGGMSCSMGNEKSLVHTACGVCSDKVGKICKC